MAQAIIYKRLADEKIKNEKENNFYIKLTDKKLAGFYKSKSYKDHVLALYFNNHNSKKFIISRSMWKIFRQYIAKIDAEFSK